jgi:pimeloyl-ACP methyl ester carboxylesterase
MTDGAAVASRPARFDDRCGAHNLSWCAHRARASLRVPLGVSAAQLGRTPILTLGSARAPAFPGVCKVDQLPSLAQPALSCSAPRSERTARPGTTLRVAMLNERFIQICGQPLRYLIGGQGKPLVLCHGFLSSAEEFGGRFSELGALRTLIIPDLPGNGASPPLRGRHTSEAMADLLFNLLAELEIDRFDVGGLCLGATVACALANRAGDRVERLILHTPLLSPDLLRRPYREQVRLLSRRPLWDGVVWLSRQRRISDLYKRFIIVEGDVDHRTGGVNYENQRRADPRAAREWLNDCLVRDDVDVVAARAEATLIIVARHDRLVDVDRLRGLIAGLPELHVFIDADQGHGWNDAAVRRQLEVLRDFLEAQPHHGSVATLDSAPGQRPRQ